MDKEDIRTLRSGRTTACWSYVGALIPIIGWILGGISLSTLNSIDEPKTDLAKIKISKAKKLAVGGIILSTVVALFYGGATILVAQSNHKAQLNQAYQTNLNQIGTLANQYDNVYHQFNNLPSTTTNTKSGWDSYYSGLVSQVQAIQTSSSNNSYSNTSLATFNTSIQTACGDFINLLNLDESNSDMNFQITSDQDQLTSDQTTLSSEESLNNNGIAEGLPSDPTYVNEYETKVANDNTRLANDQQTLKNQQSQAATLSTTVLTDSSTMEGDGIRAGYHFSD